MNPDLVYEVKIVCDWAAASDWCLEHVGEFNKDWLKLGIDPAASLFGDMTTTWYFKDPWMATLFVLKWGQAQH
jgi:hypothetical protein